MRNADLYILVHKMQKFAFKLFLCFLFTGYFFSAPVNAYWNSDSVDCKLGTVNEKKLTEKGLTKEQIEKAKATKKLLIKSLKKRMPDILILYMKQNLTPNILTK